MVYKNGFKDYLITGIVFTILYTILTSYTGLKTAIISALPAGSLFTIAITIFSIFMEKKSEHLRNEISKVRNIICEGPANYKNGLAIGGWLFLSEDALEFYPHKVNLGGSCVAILIDDIVNVDTKGKQLIIQSKNELFKFVVNKSKLWKNSINQIL